MEKIIELASQWATDLWRQSSRAWQERDQDLNYRNLLARPGLKNVLKKIPLAKTGFYLDFGCGEGHESLFLHHMLRDLGFSGTMFGYDPMECFIMRAVANTVESEPLRLYFDSGSFSAFLQRKGVAGKCYLVVAQYVLQDAPEIETILKNISDCLVPGGYALFLLVHPEFGLAMKNKGALIINADLNPPEEKVPWQFAAQYPIVEKFGQTFYVPYFHRSLGFYAAAFKKHFSRTKYFKIKPTPKIIASCEEAEIAPFCDHPGNLYYPEIIEKESSLIIVSRKQLADSLNAANNQE